MEKFNEWVKWPGIFKESKNGKMKFQEEDSIIKSLNQSKSIIDKQATILEKKFSQNEASMSVSSQRSLHECLKKLYQASSMITTAVSEYKGSGISK